MVELKEEGEKLKLTWGDDELVFRRPYPQQLESILSEKNVYDYQLIHRPRFF